MDEMLRAGQMFSDSMQQLAISSGTKAAAQQVEQINQSNMDEMQKRQAKTQAAQQLALHLVGAGANGTQIQAAKGAIMPEAINSGVDMTRVGMLKGDKSMIEMGKTQMQLDQQAAQDQQTLKNKGETDKAKIMAAAEIEKANIGADGKQLLNFNKIVQKPFDTESKPLVDSLNALEGMTAQSSLQNPISDTAVRSQIGRVIGSEKGKIPMQEMALYTGSPALAEQFQRAIGRSLNGQTLTASDRQLVTQTLQTAQATKESQLRDVLQKHAGRADENELASPTDALKKLAGGDPRLRRLAGLDQQPSKVGVPGSLSVLPPGVPAGSQLTTVRNKLTGLPQKVYASPTGQFYPAD